MQIPAYLSRSRHGVFYFRYPLPPAMHPTGKHSNIKLSLATTCPKTALRLSRGLGSFAAEFTQRIKGTGMQYQEIRTALSQFFKIRLADIKATMRETGPLPAERIELLRNSANIADMALESNDHAILFDDEKTALIAKECTLPVKSGSADFIVFRETLIKAYRSYCHQVVQESDKYAGFDFLTDHHSKPAETPEVKQPPALLNKAVADYLTELRRLKSIRDKSIDEKQGYLSILQEILGPNASLHISPEQADHVKQTIMRLPKRMRLNKRFTDMTAPQIANLPENDTDKLNNLLDTATISKYLSCYISFFDWAVKKRATKENNFKSINVKVNMAAQRRDAFEPAQLALIVSEAINEPNSSYKWGALLGCYTGARLEELAQLEISDVKQTDGIWYIDINDSNGKRLKNASSKRWVPIHSKLIELGLAYENCLKSE